MVERSCLELQFTDLPSVRLDYEQSYGLLSGLLLFRREVTSVRSPPPLSRVQGDNFVTRRHEMLEAQMPWLKDE